MPVKTQKSSRKKGVASAWVITELREAVNKNLLMPGEHIRQDYWAEKLGVSRIPIREALKILSSQGFLEHVENRGYFVQKIVPMQLRQIHRLRQLIEIEICTNIRWPSKEELKELRQIAKNTVERYRAGDYIGAYDADRLLNYKIWELSNYDFYAREARRLMALCEVNRLQAGFFKSLPNSSYKAYYQELIRVLAKHDREGLIKLEHEKHQIVIEALERAPEVLAERTAAH